MAHPYDDPTHAQWATAVQRALCAAYGNRGDIIAEGWRPTLGVDLPVLCDHSWCHGATDVWNRMFGSHGTWTREHYG